MERKRLWKSNILLFYWRTYYSIWKTCVFRRCLSRLHFKKWISEWVLIKKFNYFLKMNVNFKFWRYPSNEWYYFSSSQSTCILDRSFPRKEFQLITASSTLRMDVGDKNNVGDKDFPVTSMLVTDGEDEICWRPFWPFWSPTSTSLLH